MPPSIEMTNRAEPPRRTVVLNRVIYDADRAASRLTYGQVDELLKKSKSESYDRGVAHEKARGDRSLAVSMRQTDLLQQRLATSHNVTHKKLNKQTSVLAMGAGVAALALATAAIAQVPTIVAATSCGAKAGSITDPNAAKATLHDCRVAGDIAIAVTALASTGALLGLIISLITFCNRSRNRQDAV